MEPDIPVLSAGPAAIRRADLFQAVDIRNGLGGRVFDDGGNEALSEEKNFARAGGAISGALAEEAPGNPDDVKFTGSYVYMPTVSGHQRDLERIELGAEYIFPQLENFSIKLNYEKGRTDDTLELVDLVTLGFGFKW